MEAALSAGFTRIRPVTMTALAMIIGMVPMALALGEGGEQNAPLGQAPANTIGTGVLFTQFKKANVGTGPILTGIDRTTLDPNNPSTRWFNAAAFTTPGQFELGNASQYFGDFRNPPLMQENVSIGKRMKFPIHADRTIDVVYRADAFNIFNRTNFGNIVGVIGNANFGRPTGPQTGARLITMGVRVDF